MGISIGGKINYHCLLPISTQPIPTSQVAALTWQQYESKQNKYKEIFLTLSIHVAVFCILLCMVKLVFCRGIATYCNTTMLSEWQCRRFVGVAPGGCGGRAPNASRNFLCTGIINEVEDNTAVVFRSSLSRHFSLQLRDYLCVGCLFSQRDAHL